MNKKPTISICTSSHVWNGGFKNKIKQVFKEKSGRFQTPVVISKSSLKMSYNMARKILKDVQAQSPNPQVHVIMLGDNNLRWSHSQPEDVLAMFRFLLAKSSKIQNCKIVIVSLISTLENIEEKFQIFVNFDKELAKILDPKHDMVDLRKSLRSKNGDIKEKLFQFDGVHLNSDEAKVLANQIFNKLERLPRKFFE